MKTITSMITLRLVALVLGFSLFTTNISATVPGIAAADTNDKPAQSGSGILFASLEASANSKSVTINWKTTTEVNNDYFEVERSLDMENFKTVALVLDGFPAEAMGKIYSFKEDAAKLRDGKVVYYRLKQIDKTGAISYSPVMKVQLDK